MIGKNEGYNIIPGFSVNNLGTLISLYYGWGRDFIVLTDSDKAAKESKKRYEDEFEVIVRDRIFSLADLLNDTKIKSMESLYQDVERLDLIKKFFPNEFKYTKKKFNSAIQEQLFASGQFEFSVETRNKFDALKAFFLAKLM